MAAWRGDPPGMARGAMPPHRASGITTRASARRHPFGTGGFARLTASRSLSVAPPRTAGLSLHSRKIVLSEWFYLAGKCSGPKTCASIEKNDKHPGRYGRGARWRLRPFYRSYSSSIMLFSIPWTSPAMAPRSSLPMACMEATGSTAETSMSPPSVSCTTTLHGSMVPILFSAWSAL